MLPHREPARGAAVRAVETHIGERLRQVRLRRGMTQGDLAAAIDAAGGVPGQPEVVDGEVVEREPTRLARSTIAKIESQVRGVSLNELVTLAAVLNVSPANLMLPVDDDRAPVRLVGDRSEPTWLVRSWLYGTGPLPGADDREYLEVAPHAEFRRGIAWRHPAVMAIRELETYVRAAVAGSENRLERGPLAEALGRATAQLTQEVERLQEWALEAPEQQVGERHIDGAP